MTTEDASKDQLLNEIRRLHDELEKVPSYQEMNDHGEVYTHTLVCLVRGMIQLSRWIRLTSKPNSQVKRRTVS
ncbi:homing endonuclease associated repeat-containing protein [Halorubrum ezzemoulense]|uniref:Uncharacterized protein n=1 Tax=Halorubrum ezzemoulense TaxID=337243 RepID=A0A481RD42_HALEZ|nr:hypothetical protein [Halorubrum ezzemoulense]QAY19127.1 hypothetical protein EO776_03570 [Halorubrum ezzemoulense]